MASPPSPLSPEVLGAIERVTEEMWPGVPVIPTMSTGATDGLFLRIAGIPVYGVSGIFGDVDDILAYANDEEWSRYLPVPFPYDSSDAKEFIARSVLCDREKQPSWAVVLDGRVVGGVSLRLDRDNRVGELGWSIARSAKISAGTRIPGL